MFDLNYGTSFVYRAEIIKPDGRVIAIDPEAYSRVMTEPGRWAPTSTIQATRF
jgi:hypothetical protein